MISVAEDCDSPVSVSVATPPNSPGATVSVNVRETDFVTVFLPDFTFQLYFAVTVAVQLDASVS